MNKRNIFLSLFISLSFLAFAQKNGAIKGTIIDHQTGQSIPYANISFLNAANLSSSGSVSNEKGEFVLENLELKTYSIIVSFIGYTSDTINNIALSQSKPTVQLRNIALKVSGIALKELEISANLSTQQNKIDRKIYRTADFTTAKGGTAVDLLNKIPSLTVSADGEVSVRGTSDFLVYLNGKPTQMEPSVLLAQISSDAINNIEIITVPSAKYDAQGKGGIININTKTSGIDGLSITLNGNLGGSPWNNIRDKWSNYLMTNNRYGGGVNLLYGNNKLSLNAGMNYSMKNVNGDRDGNARILDTTNVSFKHMLASGERPEWYENLSVNAGFDYKLSEASSFSGAYFFGNRTEGRSAYYVYNNFYADKNKISINGVDQKEELLYNPNIDNRYGIFHTGNLDFKHKFKNKSDITVSILYENSQLSRELDNKNINITNLSSNTVGNTLLHYTQSDQTPLNAYRFSVDYTKVFDNNNQLNVGFIPQFMSINGNFNYDTLNIVTNKMYPYTALENGIDLYRNVYAGYAEYSGKKNKLQYLIGLRLEYTDQEMNIDNPKYFSIFDRPTEPQYNVNQIDWFPTLHSSYKINENNLLSFAANRRISRPAAKDMAPFLYRRHLEVYAVGDPGIKPQYISNVELNYEKKLGENKINLTGFYRGVDNALFRVNTVYDKEMVLIRSITNSGNTSSIGMDLNANLSTGKFAKFFVGGSLYHFRVQGEAFGYKEDNKSMNWDLKGNAILNITKELKFNADFAIKSATVTAQGNNFMFYMANIALNYVPVKLKNWNFNFKVLDILNSNIEGLDTRAYQYINNVKTEIFYQETFYYRTGSIAELNITYSLSSNKGKSKKIESTYGKSEF